MRLSSLNKKPPPLLTKPFRLSSHSAFVSLSEGAVEAYDQRDEGSFNSASSMLRRELDQERMKRLQAEDQLKQTQELLQRVQNGSQAIRERAIVEETRANQALQAAKWAAEDRQVLKTQIHELQEKLRQSAKNYSEQTSQYKQQFSELYDDLQSALSELKEQRDETTAVSKHFLQFVKSQQLTLMGRTPSPLTNAMLDEHEFVNKHKTPVKEPEVKTSRWSHHSLTPSSTDSTKAFKSIFRLPKQLIERFDGDPKKWPNFIASFMEATRGMTPAKRMAVLRHLLTEDVRNSLGDILNNPEMYDQAIQELENIYGNPHMVSKSYIRTLLQMSKKML